MSQVHSIDNSLVVNTIYMISATIYHLEGLGFSSSCSTLSHISKCSYCILNGPPAQFGQAYLTSHSISSLTGTPSDTSNVSTSTGIGSPRGGGGGGGGVTTGKGLSGIVLFTRGLLAMLGGHSCHHCYTNPLSVSMLPLEGGGAYRRASMYPPTTFSRCS